MDTENERELCDGIPRGLSCSSNLWSPSYVCVRIYEDYERNYLRLNSLRVDAVGAEMDKSVRIRTKVRCDRFWTSIIGFHTGSLDLKGRHERRYKSLMRKWHAISVELDDIERVAAGFMSEYMGNYMVFAARGIVPETNTGITAFVQACEAFHEKWKITNTADDLHQLCQNAKWKVREEMRRNPSPIYQRLLLEHLPVELICSIMQLSGPSDAFELAACSRRFHDIYTSRPDRCLTINVPYSKELLVERARGQRPVSMDLQHLAIDIAAQVTHRVDTLVSQPNCLRQVREVTVKNEWTARRLYRTAWRYKEQTLNFLDPVYQSIIKLVSGAVNLRKLVLQGLTVDSRIVETLSTIPKLSYLVIDDGFMRLPDNEVVEPKCSISVPHLTFRHGSKHGDNIFRVIASIPRIRWLEVDGSQSPSMWFFPRQSTEPHFHTLGRSLWTVERAYFRNIMPGDVEDLTSILEHARALDDSPPFCFTHLKFEIRNALPHRHLVRLLTVLSSAPLKHLVLEGLGKIDKHLFHLISRLFPKLVSLVVVHRASDRQAITKATNWGTQLSDIGPGFAGFQNLEYFACNMKFTIDPSPSAILGFERDFDGDSIAQQDLDFDLCDWLYTPRVFAAYCPTLKTVSFIQHGPMGYTLDFNLKRSPTGRVMCEYVLNEGSLGKALRHETHPPCNPYNPDMINYSWPMF